MSAAPRSVDTWDWIERDRQATAAAGRQAGRYKVNPSYGEDEVFPSIIIMVDRCTRPRERD